MQLIPHDPPTVPPAAGGYTNALEIIGASRLLFISGQIPEDADGNVPETLEGQCRQIWANITASLESAGQPIDALVKVTTYLGDRSHAAVNTAVRQEVLGHHRPALTVVVAEIFSPQWLLEIEAIAAV